MLLRLPGVRVMDTQLPGVHTHRSGAHSVDVTAAAQCSRSCSGLAVERDRAGVHLLQGGMWAADSTLLDHSML